MRTDLKHSRLLCLVVVLVLSSLLASCGILSAVQKAFRHEDGAQTATEEPASPTPEGTHKPAESSAPILERALDSVPFSLIDGRLFIQMPVGAQDIARQGDIMGAAPSSRAETRLVLEGGNGQKLVVYAQESFYYSDDLEGDADRILKQRYGDFFAYTKEPARQTGDGLKVICFSPDSIDAGTDAVLVRGAVVGLADGTFITVGVFVTPETAADTGLCLQQSGGILDTLRAGTRRVDASAHEERLGQNSIGIQLDEGYVIVQDEGADFSVFYLMKYVKLGQPAPSVGIYVGEHPSLMYLQRGVEESQLTKTKDKILNKSVEWLSYTSQGGAYYCAETYLYLNDYLIMHIFVDAADDAEFREIKDMIDTLKIRSYS
jgi:hypothetical protein